MAFAFHAQTIWCLQVAVRAARAAIQALSQTRTNRCAQHAALASISSLTSASNVWAILSHLALQLAAHPAQQATSPQTTKPFACLASQDTSAQALRPQQQQTFVAAHYCSVLQLVQLRSLVAWATTLDLCSLAMSSEESGKLHACQAIIASVTALRCHVQQERTAAVKACRHHSVRASAPTAPFARENPLHRLVRSCALLLQAFKRARCRAVK